MGVAEAKSTTMGLARRIKGFVSGKRGTAAAAGGGGGDGVTEDAEGE